MKLTGVKMPGPCYPPGRRATKHAEHNLSQFTEVNGDVPCGYCGLVFPASAVPAEWAAKAAKLRLDFLRKVMSPSTTTYQR